MQRNLASTQQLEQAFADASQTSPDTATNADASWTLVGTVSATLYVAMTVAASGGGLSFGMPGELLHQMGWKWTPLILGAGEWWRLVNPIFLHGSLMHIGFNAFALANLGPVVEEIIYRGYLQAGLCRALGRHGGVVLTAVVFGLSHGVTIAFPLFLVGLFLGWMRERSGGLCAPILAHAIHNGWTVAVTVFAPDWLGS